MRNIVILLLLAAGGWELYQQQYQSSVVEIRGDSDAQSFRSVQDGRYACDGRQHCGQMNSRAEAEYFIRNCPNTKMDGDRDGIPCENDSRF